MVFAFQGIYIYTYSIQYMIMLVLLHLRSASSRLGEGPGPERLVDSNVRPLRPKKNKEKIQQSS